MKIPDSIGSLLPSAPLSPAKPASTRPTKTPLQMQVDEFRHLQAIVARHAEEIAPIKGQKDLDFLLAKNLAGMVENIAMMKGIPTIRQSFWEKWQKALVGVLGPMLNEPDRKRELLQSITTPLKGKVPDAELQGYLEAASAQAGPSITDAMVKRYELFEQRFEKMAQSLRGNIAQLRPTYFGDSAKDSQAMWPDTGSSDKLRRGTMLLTVWIPTFVDQLRNMARASLEMDNLIEDSTKHAQHLDLWQKSLHDVVTELFASEAQKDQSDSLLRSLRERLKGDIGEKSQEFQNRISLVEAALEADRASKSEQQLPQGA